MTIEQERNIAVRALEEMRDVDAYMHPSHEARCGAMRGVLHRAIAAIKRKQALQALVDQAQDLDMGYGPAQAAPVAMTKTLIKVLEVIRHYPDFDDPEHPYAKMIDEALAGKPPVLLATIDSLSRGEMPAAQPVGGSCYCDPDGSIGLCKMAQPVGEAVDINEVPHLIFFDDRDRAPELLIGRERALIRYKQISDSWNAHLFVKINSNSRDCRYPSAILSAPQDGALLDRQYLAGFDAGFMAGEAGDIDKRTSVHAARDAAMLAGGKS